MNNFKTIRDITEADADEYVIDIDDDEEELMAKAGKEAEFVDLHTAVSIAHPVAGDNQFKSDKDSVRHKDAESDNAEGEDKPVKQGTTGDTKFAQFRNTIGKTPTRKGDKNQGDKKAETVKEEVELDEALSPKDMAAVEKYVDTFMSRLPKDLKVKVMKNPKVAAKILADVATKGKLVEEVELDEAVKAGMMKLKDGKSVKVSPVDAKMFNTVLKELNPENRKRMEMEMMKDQKSYKEMLTFAKRTG